MTAGGNCLDYPDDTISPTVSIIDANIHFNSTISYAKRRARYMTLDIKNYYLGSPMHNKQFLRIHQSMIPQEIMDKYDLVIEDDVNVYMMI